MPQIEFSEAISDQIRRFSTFFARSFLGTSAFSEFTNLFKCGVYTGSHAHQRMRLEKLVWKNTVSARDLESEIKIFQKTIFKSVRRPFSSWSDRTPFSYQHAIQFLFRFTIASPPGQQIWSFGFKAVIVSHFQQLGVMGSCAQSVG